jgi:putative hemolysin
MSSLLEIFAVVAFLIAVNGLYVAAEFSAVSAKRSRLSQLAAAGDSSARALVATLGDPHKLDAYIAACQVGITLSSLLLGFYAQARLIELSAPHFNRLASEVRSVVQPAAAIVILLLLTILQVVLGELIPKNLGTQYPERLALWTARPMQWSLLIFRPLIWLFNGSGRLILHLLRQRTVAEHAHVHSPEEIVFLVEESSAGGVLDREERRLLVNTLQLRHRTVRQVMAPRNRILAAPVDQPPETVFHLLAGSPYSRLPLYEGSIDQIVGLVHLKDLLRLYPKIGGMAHEDALTLRAVMHPPLFVPDSISIEEVIAHMQRTRQNVAIVVDEYGGTAGMVTFEDLSEEIIGDFQDEFDAEHPILQLHGRNHLITPGDLQIDDLNALLGTHFASEEVETIGGLVATALGKIPAVGDRVVIDGMRIRVAKMDGQRVAELHLVATPEQAQRLREMSDE